MKSIALFPYCISVFFMMCASYYLSFTWKINAMVWFLLASIMSIIFYSHNKKEFRITKKEQSILVLWSICSLYIALSPGFNLGNLLRNLLIWLSGVVLICMSLKLKMKFLGFVSRGTSFILCFSLIGWGIYHMGIPLPNKIVTDYDDGYHILSDYFFFLINENSQFDFYQRFTSLFIEPGQMASICVILLFSNIFLKGKRFDIIILAISLICSFSLAGWMVTAIGFFLMLIMKYQSKVILLFFFIFILGLFLTIKYVSEDSLVGKLIIERLVFDEEKGFAGNNRTGEDFEYNFEKYIQSKKCILGLDGELHEGNNWTTGNSGYKVTIVYFGFVGLLIMLLLLFKIFIINRSSYGFVLFCCYLLLGAIRNFWLNPYWLFILICAIPLIQQQNKLQSSNLVRK